MSKPTLHVSVTGGAGQIAYQLLFRIAAGELFTSPRPIALQILDLPPFLPSLEGVKMELEDCAFPLLEKIEITADRRQAFKDADVAILIGAKPRGPGMERGDLLQENGKIFVEQGKALNDAAKKDVKVFVVGNPCNTNCLIARSHAPRLQRRNFFALTRLDQNRASFFLAKKANAPICDVSHVAIWGNHSSTQVPDFTHARIRGQLIEEVIRDRSWLEGEFFQLVQKRGAAVIQARGKSSAGSASQAILDAVRDTLSPTPNGEWFSSAVDSKGNPYGIHEELIYSFPSKTDKNVDVHIVEGLELSEFLRNKLKLSERELLEERDLVRSLMGHE